MTIIELTFWLSLAFIAYTYAGYPLLMKALALVRPRPVRKAAITPPLTVIITAHNEEARLAAKLENTLALDYPPERLQVIVASDCSTDATDSIARGYAGRGVELVRSPVRGGKERAQRLALTRARGDIVVFTDAASRLERGVLRRLAANFADESVGCVSSEDRVLPGEGQSGGEGFYVRYEMLLRRLESEVCSLVGLSGSCFAARKRVCANFSETLPSDFNTLLECVRRGLRGVSEPAALCYYRPVADEREFQRKVRTVVRGLTGLAANRDMLNPFRHGLFSLSLASHKLCRWLVPFALALSLAANLALAPASPFYRALLLLQALFYALAWAGMRSRPLARLLVVKVPFFFVTVNTSIAVAWLKFLRGERIVAWQPSER